ncbi:MAG: hypothetical protein OXG58_00660 [Gemmatimonadetes bacterium]|nr:hypothetical protein [Gemmatimonadota bacterium]MCY3944631.1 hypothetical protein [Gemmatimonadota bacterium]
MDRHTSDRGQPNGLEFERQDSRVALLLMGSDFTPAPLAASNEDGEVGTSGAPTARREGT